MTSEGTGAPDSGVMWFDDFEEWVMPQRPEQTYSGHQFYF